jgi:hypothetical protein
MGLAIAHRVGRTLTAICFQDVDAARNPKLEVGRSSREMLVFLGACLFVPS